jgi:hypothetical protein
VVNEPLLTALLEKRRSLTGLMKPLIDEFVKAGQRER